MQSPGSPSQSPTASKSRPSPRAAKSQAKVARLGRYRLIRPLGKGGMGVVYEAEDTKLHRTVAIKVLPADVADNAEALARFRREGQAAARLNLANVVAIYDVGESDGTHFIVMELVTGGSAQDSLKKNGPMAWPAATRVLIDVCRGVAAAHRAGLIHRDIKPANILRANDGTVKLGDFGLVKALRADAISGASAAGTAIGTPHFMSPEQIQGTRVDERSDIYSLGATYYALLTGMAPYAGSDPVQVLFAHCSRPVPDPRSIRADLPPECAAIVARAMAKERTDRYPDAAALMADLMTLLDAVPADVESTLMPFNGIVGESAPTSRNVSIAGDYLGEQTVADDTRVIRKRRWPLVTVILAIAVILAGVGYAVFRPRDSAAPIVAKELPPEKDDWASLGTAAENAIRDRQAAAMKRVLERMRTTKNRDGLPADEELRGAVLRLFARLEKTIAFRERITEKGLVIGMSGHVSAVGFSPDDHWLGAGNSTADGGVTVWDSWSGEKHIVLGPRRNNVSVNVQAMSFSHDSKTVVAACGDVPSVKTWQIDTGKERPFVIDKSVRRVSSVAFSPASRKFVAGFEPAVEGFAKMYLKIWDADTGREPFAFKAEHRGRIIAVAFTAGGQQAVTASGDKRVIFWDAETGRIWREIHPELRITAIACAPRGGLLAVAGVDDQGESVLQVWDYVGERKLTKRVLRDGICRTLAYSADGAVLASGSGSTIVLWNADTHVAVTTLIGHGFEVVSLAFPARGGILASGSEDQSLRLWDVSRFVK